MYDLVVIGGGAGGLSVATAAARIGASVALIERAKLGGECTHSACVPSKTLIRSARAAHEVRIAGRFGIRVVGPVVDFPAVMERVRSAVAGFAREETVEALAAKGIDVFSGAAAFEAYDTVVVDGPHRISGHRFVIATGSRPAVPPIPGLREVGYLDNESIWSLTELPDSLVVVGGGPVGIEFAQAFARLGSKVTVLADGPRILPREDAEISERVRVVLAAEGIAFQLGVEVTAAAARAGGTVFQYRSRATGDRFEVECAQVLVATGRLANVEGLNLDRLGIPATREHGIDVDEFLRTSAPNVWAIGDVTGRYQFTHAAERAAAVVFQNAVLRLHKRMEYSTIPWTTFTDPEVATVGLTEANARRQDPAARVFRLELEALDRARIDGATDGLAKVVTSGSGHVLGVTILAPEAGAVIQEFVLAMERGLTLGDLMEVVHSYPTYGGIVHRLALAHGATRLEQGLVRAALRWVYGFESRTGEHRSDEHPTASG
jgi:pyruvate/2-oxoglutarate dehydrogenase complex dihydrolipoamide dehydrogenase (E3) component